MTDTFECPIAEQHGKPFRYCPFKGCGWHEPIPPADGAALIAAERVRQIDMEYFTPEHDAEHTRCQMAVAARGYVYAAVVQVNSGMATNTPTGDGHWPEGWDWKPSPDPIRNLVRAGALIAAEIDRLQRGMPT